MTIEHLGKPTVSPTGILCALFASLLWATIGVTCKRAVPQVPSFTTTVYVNFFATGVLGLNLIVQKKLPALSKAWATQRSFFWVAGVVGLGLQQVCYLTGYQLLPASQVVAIFYCYPLLMALLAALWLRQPCSPKSLLLVAVGWGGVYLLIAEKSWAIALNLGTALTLIAAASWACFSIWIQHRQFEPDAGMFLASGFGLLFLLGLVPVWGLTWTLTPTEWSGILYLAVFPTAIACLLWNQALHRCSTTLCSAIALLTPLFSVLLNAVILHESLLPTQLVGLAVLLGAVMLNLKN